MRRSGLGWWVAAAALLPIAGAVASRYTRYAVGVELGALALVVNLAALGLVLVLIGKALTGDPFGVALGALNRYSLARAQAALWTVVVFATLLTAAEWNLAMPAPAIVASPLDLTIPPELLTAVGISLFTAVAAPAIAALRGDSSWQASDAQMAAAADRTRALTGTEPDLVRKGQVISNRSAGDASWRDLLTGDDVSLAGRVDLSKVQQALLTVIIVGIYVASFVEALAPVQWLPGLPKLGGDAVRLLAISHAGYLGFKAIPKPDAALADSPGARAAPARIAAVTGQPAAE